MLLKFSPAQSRASRTTGTMARRCSREASSGTTPPYFPWVVICEATIEERMVPPSATTAAAVSSHEDSMPRMRTPLYSSAGQGVALPYAKLEQPRSCARAALSGALQIEKMGTRRMSRLEGLDGVRHTAEDDSQLTIEVMRRRSRHRASLVSV